MKLPIDILKAFDNPSKYGYRLRNIDYVGNTIELVMHHKKEIMMHQLRYHSKRNRHFTEGISLEFKYDTNVSELNFKAIEKLL